MMDRGDVAALSKIPGVGKKAGKMMLSLKGKLSLEEVGGGTAAKKTNSPYDALISSLSDMGYDRRDAEDVISRLAADFAQDEKWQKMLPTEREDMLFRRAIVEMAR